MSTTDVDAVNDPGLAWLAAQLRWERALETMRLHRAVTGSPRLHRERSAA